MSESDQESHESELADRSLFVQELVLLAITAADEGVLAGHASLGSAALGSSAVTTMTTTHPVSNSVAKSTPKADAVVNCSAKTSHLHTKNSADLLRSDAAQTGNSQHNSLSRGGAKR